MSKTVKAIVTEAFKTRYEGIVDACVVDITGLNVQTQEHIRKVLREKSARLQVVKNSMARRAFSDGPLAPLGDALDGPCALVVSDVGIIGAAKALVEVAQGFSELTLKQAIMAGHPDLLTVEAVARMKSREELFADVAGLIGSPGRALAGCLCGPQSRIAGCLKAMVDKAA